MTEPGPFEAFLRDYQNLVFTTAVRLLGRPEEAQDIAQEVFMKAYERFDQLSQSPTVGGWLKTVTTNLCLNHLSRYRARLSFFTDFFSNDPDSSREFEIEAPDTACQQAQEADFKRLLEQALQKLPTRQRVPLVLYHFDELSYEEIAARLKISLSKVKTDIFRAREALRKVLRLLPGLDDELADRDLDQEPRDIQGQKPTSLWQDRCLFIT